MIFYAVLLSMYIYAGSSLGSGSLTQWFGRDEQATQTLTCGTDMPARENLSASNNSQLRKLAEYEHVCGSAFADTHMLFSGMPATSEEAMRLGNQLATKLKEFDEYTVRPLVIVEPVTPDGTMLSMAEVAAGTYDEPLAAFFRTLEQRGVTDGMMGTWVPFPEANTPAWVSTDATQFSQAVTRMVRLQKLTFPDSKASVMLGSQTYPSNDTEWLNGSFKSLTPYTQGIPKGLIDSFGYQGFPWQPAANTNGYELIDPKKFLRTDYAIGAAEALGVRTIWLNTGTFARSHTADSATEVAMSPAERARILTGITDQAAALKRQGFEVSINIFAEDKSATVEAVDWSYWPAGEARNSKARPVLTDFMRRSNEQGVPVWIFDDDASGMTASESYLRHR